MISLQSTKLLVLFAFGLYLVSLIYGAPVRRSSLSTNNTTTSNNTSNSCNCTEDDDDQGPICASNGITYQREYDLCLYNCEHNTNITIKAQGECRNCTKFAATLQQAGAGSGVSIDLIMRCSEGKQTLKDLISLPYTPTCQNEPEKNHLFAPRQYNSLCQLYWCATPDGDPISRTVSEDKIDCDGICVVNSSVTYRNKETFYGNCGPCECINGTITCVKDYCSLDDAITVNKLKSDILKLYLLQNTWRKPDVQISLVYIRKQEFGEFNDKEVTRLLDWKFLHYDVDKNDHLSASDLIKLYTEIYRLIKNTQIVEQMKAHLDTDNSGTVSKTEFKTFFTSQHSEASGSLEQVGIALS